MGVQGTNFASPIVADETTLTKIANTISVKTQGINTAQLVAGAATNTIVANGITGNGNIFIQPALGKTVIQGTWAIGIAATYFLNGNFYNSSALQNDEVNYPIFLEIGTYSIALAHSKNSDHAIATLSIDAGIVGTIDFYNATDLQGQISTINNIAITTRGLKTLKIKAATKNGSSTGYLLSLQAIYLWRTA